MNQQGYVMEIVDNKTVKLRMQRHSACASCGKCKDLSYESKEILVEADNTIGAHIGDYVEVNMENINILRATALAYLLPLVFLIIGTSISYSLLYSITSIDDIVLELISGGMGLCFMLVAYIILRKNDKKFRESRKFIPVITKIL